MQFVKVFQIGYASTNGSLPTANAASAETRCSPILGLTKLQVFWPKACLSKKSFFVAWHNYCHKT
jgi:hypothetical protein